MFKFIIIFFGIEISLMFGGIFVIIVVSIMLIGIIGNVIVLLISKIFRVKYLVVVGIGIGVLSYVVGILKVMEIGEIEGLMSVLLIVFVGLLIFIWVLFLKFLV